MKTLNRFLTVCFLLFAAVSIACADEKPKLKALIVDGQNNHNWRATTPVLKDILETSGRFTADVATMPTAEEKKADENAYYQKLAAFRPAFEKYDVVIGNCNDFATHDEWSAETKKAFEKYVADGGGYVSYHAADNAFPKWGEYNKIIAIGGWQRPQDFGKYLYWKDGKQVTDETPGRCGSHGPQWDFLITIRDDSHPITKGLPKEFRHCKDELYDSLRGPAENVSIKATALADKEHGGTGRDEPMLMTVEYGKGRVFHTTLGHDVPMLKSVSFIITFLRGAEWAATGAVTIPVPDDMPGRDKPAFR